MRSCRCSNLYPAGTKNPSGRAKTAITRFRMQLCVASESLLAIVDRGRVLFRGELADHLGKPVALDLGQMQVYERLVMGSPNGRGALREVVAFLELHAFRGFDHLEIVGLALPARGFDRFFRQVHMSP